MYLGINSYSHDSGACLIDEEGKVIAAAEEERFTQKKHTSVFPENSIKFCLQKAGITTKDLKGIAIGWNRKEMIWDRIIKEYLFIYHVPFEIFRKSIVKFWGLITIKSTFQKKIGKLAPGVKIKYYIHHEAHAASAFYASGFDDAAFLTVDGRGEYDCSLWGTVDYINGIQPKGRLHHPHSIGCVWGAISEYCGFSPGWMKAGTTMAFAALGKPKYLDEFKKILTFDPTKDNDWFLVDNDYINNDDCKGMYTPKFEKQFGPAVKIPGEYAQVHYDVAATMQEYHQYIILEKLKDIYAKTKKTKLVMAGGVALNSVTNGLILEKTPFKELFIQPASHDAGSALGAVYTLYQEFHKSKKPAPLTHAYLGPEYSSEEIEVELKKHADVLEFTKEQSMTSKVAKLLYKGEVIMWFQGRSEFGPRALGSRSILASVTDKNMIDKLNQTKHRESFRPFAISILEDKAREWLVKGDKSPYMLLVDHIKTEFKDRVPAAQHVDGSVRVQTVNKEDNGIYYDLLKEYTDLSGIPMFINTSFNIKGLPIVNDPKQAITAFLESKDIKYLAIESYLVTRKV